MPGHTSGRDVALEANGINQRDASHAPTIGIVVTARPVFADVAFSPHAGPILHLAIVKEESPILSKPDATLDGRDPAACESTGSRE
ncbi:MAG: hypothetical protein QM811_06720 [Pirellulales bacterium]